MALAKAKKMKKMEVPCVCSQLSCEVLAKTLSDTAFEDFKTSGIWGSAEIVLSTSTVCETTMSRNVWEEQRTSASLYEDGDSTSS